MHASAKMLKLINRFLSAWKRGGIEHSARTGIGAVASLVVAHFLGMPDAYWAPITTLVVMQSTLGTSWDVSKPRFIGNVLGAAMGGLLATYSEPGVAVFGVVIFALGLICVVLRLDNTAYPFASVTFAMVFLVARANAPWLIAVQRFVEVSIGITVALALTAIWPEHESTSGDARS